MFDCKVYLGEIEFYYIEKRDLNKILEAYNKLPEDAFGKNSILQFMKSGIVINQLHNLAQFGEKGVFLNQWQVDHAKEWMEYARL